MSPRPERVGGTRLCLCLTREGLTAYGNRQAFAALGEYMRWLEHSPDEEYYECHVTWSLEDEASRFEGKRPRNVWVLLEKGLADAFPLKTDDNPGVELTFMLVPDGDLDEMAGYQDRGILPDNWNQEA